MDIHVVGPRDRNTYPGISVINVTSHAQDDWQRAFSPFFLGPVSLYAGRSAKIMENAWQFAKVYSAHLDANGQVTDDYWRWAKEGWASARPARYPMGKGVKPQFLLWNDQRLGYIDARLQVYFSLYRDAVRKRPEFERLQKMAATQELVLWDFDGYDHEHMNASLGDVLRNDRKICGHGFVLKAMLLYGPEVTPDMVFQKELESQAIVRPKKQMSLL